MLQMLIYALVVGILATLGSWEHHASGASGARLYEAGLLVALVLGVTWAGASLQLVDQMLTWTIAALVAGLGVGAGIGWADSHSLVLWGAGGAAAGILLLGVAVYHMDLLEGNAEGQAYLVASLGGAVVVAAVGADVLGGPSQGMGMGLLGGVGGAVIGAFGTPLYMAREKENAEDDQRPGGW